MEPSLSLAEPGALLLSEGLEGARLGHCRLPPDRYCERADELVVLEDVADGVGDGSRPWGPECIPPGRSALPVTTGGGSLTGQRLLPSLRHAFFRAVAEIPSALAACSAHRQGEKEADVAM